MKILPLIPLLLTFDPTFLLAAETEPTICRSAPDEERFRSFAEAKIEVLAVCPKKGLYFVEILANGSDVEEFKARIKAGDSTVTKITNWKAETSVGSRVLMVEFEY